jgi:MerR family transcriptional regulator, light-induced transcriptional regulator
MVLIAPPVRGLAHSALNVSYRTVAYTFCTVISLNLYVDAVLTIGTLARRTGVSVSTLRAWERRYGFPVPRRLAGGHRRYTERDVEAILWALRDRHAGSSIALALERAKAVSLGPRSSLFGALRHALPEVAPAALSKRGMLMLSRAMEDEIAGRADRPILIAAFQHERFWRASEARWRNLAATAKAAIVLAALRRPRHGDRLWEVRIETTTPIAREWVVLCDSPTFSACLVGVELPDATERTFEVLWTTEPIVVRDVARIAGDIAITHAPAVEAVVKAQLDAPAVTNYDSVRATTALTNRVVAYMDPARRFEIS